MFLEHKTVYTIPQCRAGGRISGESRRYLVLGRHAQVRELHHAGHSNGMIARITGYHRSTVGRILRGIIRTCLTAWETAKRAIAYPLRHNHLSHLYKDCSRNTPSARPKKRRKRRPASEWIKAKWAAEESRKAWDQQWAAFGKRIAAIGPDAVAWYRDMRLNSLKLWGDQFLCGPVHARLVDSWDNCPYCGYAPTLGIEGIG